MPTDSKNSRPSSAGVLGVLGVTGELPLDLERSGLGIFMEVRAAFAFFRALGMVGRGVGGDGGGGEETGRRVWGANTVVRGFIDGLDACRPYE